MSHNSPVVVFSHKHLGTQATAKQLMMIMQQLLYVHVSSIAP